MSYTTPGTRTWTAPAGVSFVDVSGRGGSRKLQTSWSSSGAYRYVTQGVYTFNANPTGTNLGTSVSISSVQSTANGLASQWNAITTSSSGAFYSGLTFYEYFYKSSTGEYFRRANSYSGTYRRTGTVTITGTLFNQSGNVTATHGTLNSQAGSIQRLTNSYIYGGNSTAFGKTFPDNSSSATYTGVSVTAGTTYTIVVGANADSGNPESFVSFDYY